MKIVLTLDTLLTEKGISQQALSRMTGIRYASINEMCKNQTKRLPLDNLAMICKVLDCGILDIMHLEEPT